MRLFIFSVRDRASDQFGNPFYAVAPGQAIRSFSDNINKNEENNPMYQHPDDFDMYLLGEFDTNLGTFETKIPEMVSVGKMVKVREDKD